MERRQGALAVEKKAREHPPHEKKGEKQRGSAVKTMKPQDSHTVYHIYIYSVPYIYIYGTLYIYIWYTVCESCVLIKTERECGKDCEATGFTHSVLCFNEYSYIYIYQIAIFEEILLSQISLLFQLLYLKKLFLLTEKFG